MSNSEHILVLYRICATENSKCRPTFFSKGLCIRSALRALAEIDNYTLSILSDGAISEEIHEVASRNDRVIEKANLGNSGSFLMALDLANSYSRETIIYFLEDDYLHQIDAFYKLRECFRKLNPDYLTLYDHPARYQLIDGTEPDLEIIPTKILFSGSHHWRSVESTCMTFAARVLTLQEDRRVFESHLSGPVPRDRALFRDLQGLTGSRFRRTLIGPVPSLATHCEVPWLAPVIPWEQVAEDAKSYRNPSHFPDIF